MSSLAVMAALAGVGPAAPPARPNVLVVLADNWAWPHAGAYRDPAARTPNFDRVCADGVRFRHAFCVVPSCAPARATLLTGQHPHRLGPAASNWGTLPKEHAVFPELLEAAGYHVGHAGKGWAPGSVEESGRPRNPAGPAFAGFDEFLKTVPADRPFGFWYGSRDPHRGYVKGSGAAAGLKPDAVVVPKYLPDTPEVRGDVCDYLFAVERFDKALGEMLDALKAAGRADNTLVVVAGDNGWQMPRGLGNVYDSGTRVPLAVRWPARVKGGRTADAFVDFTDLAPTILAAAGLKPPAEMTGRSLLGVLDGKPEPGRDRVYLERERHAHVRADNLGYPCRAVRTKDFLYVRNLRPDRWPAGDPELVWAVGPFGDVDPSPTKDAVLATRDDRDRRRFFDLSFAKRPAEELYDLSTDPDQVTNVADNPDFAAAKRTLRADLDAWAARTADPRATDATDDRWDRYPYFGPKKKP